MTRPTLPSLGSHGQRPGGRRYQDGAATLLVGMLFLFGSAALTLGAARTAVIEQRIANNSLFAQESQLAAEGGLAFLVAWLGRHGTERGGVPLAAPDLAPATQRRYGVQLSLTPEPLAVPPCLLAQAMVADDAGSGARATVSACVRQERLLRLPAGVQPPPLILNGCIGETSPGAAPRIQPCSECEDPLALVLVSAPAPGFHEHDEIPRDDETGDGIGDETAGQDLDPTAETTPLDCADPAERLDLQDGRVLERTFDASLWDSLFSLSREEVQARAEYERAAPAAERRFHWIDARTPWAQGLGTPQHPVVLIFAEGADCPDLNAAVTIHGLLYMDAEPLRRCGGWGDATLYGSAILDGPLDTTFSPVIHDWTRIRPDEHPAALNPVVWASLVPGTWRDW